MPVFEIDQYELHSQLYRVAADSAAEAVGNVLNGEVEPYEPNNGPEYIETADEYGMHAADNPDLANGLRNRGFHVGKIIPSIRSVEEVAEERPPNER